MFDYLIVNISNEPCERVLMPALLLGHLSTLTVTPLSFMGHSCWHPPTHTDWSSYWCIRYDLKINQHVYARSQERELIAWNKSHFVRWEYARRTLPPARWAVVMWLLDKAKDQIKAFKFHKRNPRCFYKRELLEEFKGSVVSEEA